MNAFGYICIGLGAKRHFPQVKGSSLFYLDQR